MAYRFRHVLKTDEQAVMRLYKEIIGTPGCTWNQDYPAIEDIRDDTDSNSLYCIEDDCGSIVAVAAAGSFNELQHLSWDIRITNPCELARIGVHPSVQNKGLGSIILSDVIADCKIRGFDGMRFLVSKENGSALKLYDKFGFQKCGETFMYGHDFYCYQMVF
jgi:ribosomal protein S18 acetylase RimI-like enzyme